LLITASAGSPTLLQTGCSKRDDGSIYVEPGRDRVETLQSEQNTKSSSEEISRRQAMTFLISTPATIFRLTADKQSTLLHPEEVLALSRVNIPLCWKLYFEGGFPELEQVLPGYLVQLAILAQSTSIYRQPAAVLASQGHQLAYLLALQNQDFGVALKHTQDATRYGEQAADVNLQMTARVRQAYIYFCLKRSAQRLQTYEEALHSSNGCSPLIQGYIYAGLAEACANRKEKDAALKMLQRAYAVFPERPEDDPHFAYTHFRWLTLHNLEGLVYLHLDQARQAWNSFDKVDRALAQAIIPHRVELTVYQAATALKLSDLEQSCHLLTTAVQAAVKLGSHLRYQEACRVYDQMQVRWPREQQVKTLQELFQ
jgi:tetratricopeptide (TPR) repeat protein